MENFILKKLFAIGLIAAAGLVSGEVKDHWFFGEDYGELLPGSGNGIALWRTSSARKVPRRRKAPVEKCRGLGIRTAANEAEAVQLVITPEQALGEVKVSLGTLVCSKAGVELPGRPIISDAPRCGPILCRRSRRTCRAQSRPGRASRSGSG